MRTKTLDSARCGDEINLGEYLAVRRMLSEGCPNVQPICAVPEVAPGPTESNGPGDRGGGSMVSLNVGSRIHGFDEPLGLLSDCHRRIEHFLGMLSRIARDFSGRSLTAEAENAVRTAKHYFAHAFPKHTADEEESLFPVMKAMADAQGEPCEAIDKLEADHEEANALHLTVDALLEQWLRDGQVASVQSQELIAKLGRLQEIYLEHIRIEDDEVFPLAATLLSAEQLVRVGQEMQARRGIKASAVVTGNAKVIDET